MINKEMVKEITSNELITRELGSTWTAWILELCDELEQSWDIIDHLLFQIELKDTDKTSTIRGVNYMRQVNDWD